ncbi:hypothetical protein [Brucella anthropi]|uniref:hypothetical protein n=1 Tax=Brucella anthropi TaxID=529 RepID=UPI000CFB43C3|nr:hypothetical protein [Ochrobactrum sp. MYb49]PQZ61774.1 hypothetical protein CQ057_22590 [Ochrobactrum sp. MYb49]
MRKHCYKRLSKICEATKKSEPELAYALGLSRAALKSVDDPVVPLYIQLALSAQLASLDPDPMFRSKPQRIRLPRVCALVKKTEVELAQMLGISPIALRMIARSSPPLYLQFALTALIVGLEPDSRVNSELFINYVSSQSEAFLLAGC